MWLERWKAGEGLKVLNGAEEYIGKQREKKIYVRIGAFLIGLYVIYYGIVNFKLYYSALALMVCLAALFFKDIAATEKGVEIRYLLPGWHFESPWTWAEVTHIAIDYKKARPHVMLHIGKGNVHRMMTVTAQEAADIEDLAKEQNPAIKVTTMTD